MSKLPDSEIVKVIKGGGRAIGKSTTMPPWGRTLTDEEIVGLKDFMREFCKCTGPQ
jgi:mono/diheme cytochrome c family protein